MQLSAFEHRNNLHSECREWNKSALFPFQVEIIRTLIETRLTMSASTILEFQTSDVSRIFALDAVLESGNSPHGMGWIFYVIM